MKKGDQVIVSGIPNKVGTVLSNDGIFVRIEWPVARWSRGIFSTYTFDEIEKWGIVLQDEVRDAV